MLGRAFVRQIARFAPAFEVRALSRSEWDVRDRAPIDEHARWVEGGWIVHAGSLVDMERCSTEAEIARDIIVGGTANVARIAELSGARIFYPQSVFVYDGLESPITERTLLHPLSIYGALKLAAETIVLSQSPSNLVFRMAGFLGGEEKDTNFVGWIVPHIHGLIRAGQKTFAVGDRIWQPTYTLDIALNALLLYARDCRGVYVLASHGEVSFWELTVEIARLLGWSERIELVHTPFKSFSESELGHRPARSVIFNQRLHDEGVDLQRPWQEALAEYLAGSYFDQYRFPPSR